MPGSLLQLGYYGTRNNNYKFNFNLYIGMKIKDAEAITHSLSKPGKMPGFAYSTPAHECKTGTKLRAVKGSVCFNCYAYERGRYRFQNVRVAQYKRLEAIKHPLWARAMAVQINSKKVKYFRWHDSGDVQNRNTFKRFLKCASSSQTLSTGCQRAKRGRRTTWTAAQKI